MTDKVLDVTVFEQLGAELNMDSDDVYKIIFALCNDYISGYLGDNIEGDWESRDRQIQVVLEKYGYEHLEQDGGGEFGSEDCYGVFKLRDKFYKAYYSYYSCNGPAYDDIVSNTTEVNAIQRMATFYE